MEHELCFEYLKIYLKARRRHRTQNTLQQPAEKDKRVARGENDSDDSGRETGRPSIPAQSGERTWEKKRVNEQSFCRRLDRTRQHGKWRESEKSQSRARSIAIGAGANG